MTRSEIAQENQRRDAVHPGTEAAVRTTDSTTTWPSRVDADRKGPLAGVRVLDLTAYAVGPWAASLLAQMGADVIRVDPPYGDPIRAVMPTREGEPTTYCSSNLGKRSVILDLKDPADREVAVRLASAADVVVENARAGTMDRLGMGYEQLRAVNPGLVYCSSSSFGDAGPLQNMGSTDPQGQAFSGFASITGHPGEGPEVFRYVAQIDLATSMYLLQAVLIGLYARRRTGQSQYIRTSQMEAAIALQTTRFAEFFANGQSPGALGSGSAVLVPSRAFQCQDGTYVSVTAHTDALWQVLCAAVERPDLAADERLRSNQGRIEHRDEVDAALAAALRTRPALWWSKRLARAGVPCVRLRTLEDAPDLNEHFRLNRFVNRVPHPIAGEMAVAGPMWSFEKSRVEQRQAALPGAHTREIVEWRAASDDDD
ncbi:CaiB/BaiF CoA transferase family protein [Geodermatophilus sp. URMC 64]